MKIIFNKSFLVAKIFFDFILRVVANKNKVITEIPKIDPVGLNEAR